MLGINKHGILHLKHEKCWNKYKGIDEWNFSQASVNSWKIGDLLKSKYLYKNLLYRAIFMCYQIIMILTRKRIVSKHLKIYI